MQRMTLTDRLRLTDKNKRLPNHPEVKRIQRNVENVIKHILDRVQNADERFENKLLCVGSYYDGFKVGLPDEFDYLVELTNLVEHDNFEVRPTGFHGTTNLWRTSKGHRGLRKVSVMHESIFCRKFFEDKDETEKWPLITQVGRKSQPEYILNSVNMKHLFFDHVLKALDDIRKTSLPKLVEVLDETTDLHGPAVTLQLIWNGRAFKNLKISIDLTICLKVEDWEKCLDVFCRIDCQNWLKKPLEFILKQNGCHLTPYEIEEPVSLRPNQVSISNTRWRISTSYVENQIMNLLPTDCDMKLLIRGIKITRDSELLLSTKLPPLSLMFDPTLAKDSEFIRCVTRLSDLLPSYLIKTVGFLLLSEVPWTQLQHIPLPNLYIFMICNLYRFIADDCMENFFVNGFKLNSPEIDEIIPGFYEVFKTLGTEDIIHHVKTNNRTKRSSDAIFNQDASDRTELQHRCMCHCRPDTIDFRPESLEKLLLDTKSNLQAWYDIMWD